jgi:hypothetical protein
VLSNKQARGAARFPQVLGTRLVETTSCVKIDGNIRRSLDDFRIRNHQAAWQLRGASKTEKPDADAESAGIEIVSPDNFDEAFAIRRVDSIDVRKLQKELHVPTDMIIQGHEIQAIMREILGDAEKVGAARRGIQKPVVREAMKGVALMDSTLSRIGHGSSFSQYGS